MSLGEFTGEVRVMPRKTGNLGEHAEPNVWVMTVFRGGEEALIVEYY